MKLLLCLILIAGLVGFGLANANHRVPEIVLWPTGLRWHEVPLGVTVVAGFVAGALVALLASAASQIERGRRLRRLERRRRQLEDELAGLRRLPLEVPFPGAWDPPTGSM